MHTGYIFLSGGGDIEKSFEFDENYFSILPERAKILYIPIALDRRMVGFEVCYDWFSGLVSKHAEGKDIDFTMLLQQDRIQDLNIFDSMYVGGGNAYKLLDYFMSNNLTRKIEEYIEKGGIYYGGSAGAMILGKDLRIVEEENDKNYSRFEGLNLLGDKSVMPHYESSLDKKIFEFAKKFNSKVIAITEKSGVIVHEDVLETRGDVFIFDSDDKKQI